ncbi:MAG TPA: serine hydrolase domain-containing protein [Thermoanaerobaculia bacterium]|nr:serine hydrolase domain-containing protein [Thermoanaerobaculia bacterium]
MRSPRRASIERLLAELIETGVASAAVALVGNAEEVEGEWAAGWAREGVRAEPGSWFDFASLTKPFIASLALILDRDRSLALRLPIGEVFAGAHPRLAGRPLEDLLRHRSGLGSWTPLYDPAVGTRRGRPAAGQTLAGICELLLSGSLLGARPGTYSDLDYLLWGMAAERVLGRSLGELVAARVLAPLGLSALASPGDLPQVARSRMGTGREAERAAAQGLSVASLPPPPIGLPQDGNGRFLAGLAGGAGALFGFTGLFGPAHDLWRLGAEWLRPRRLLHRQAVAAALAGGSPFALGWWRRRCRGGGGPALSPRAFGHTGFAGGNLWIDPDRRRVFTLLAHRIDPASDLNRWRRRFHEAAVERLAAPQLSRAKEATR